MKGAAPGKPVLAMTASSATPAADEQPAAPGKPVLAMTASSATPAANEQPAAEEVRAAPPSRQQQGPVLAMTATCATPAAEEPGAEEVCAAPPSRQQPQPRVRRRRLLRCASLSRAPEQSTPLHDVCAEKKLAPANMNSAACSSAFTLSCDFDL